MWNSTKFRWPVQLAVVLSLHVRVSEPFRKTEGAHWGSSLYTQINQRGISFCETQYFTWGLTKRPPSTAPFYSPSSVFDLGTFGQTELTSGKLLSVKLYSTSMSDSVLCTRYWILEFSTFSLWNSVFITMGVWQHGRVGGTRLVFVAYWTIARKLALFSASFLSKYTSFVNVRVSLSVNGLVPGNDTLALNCMGWLFCNVMILLCPLYCEDQIATSVKRREWYSTNSRIAFLLRKCIRFVPVTHKFESL